MCLYVVVVGLLLKERNDKVFTKSVFLGVDEEGLGGSTGGEGWGEEDGGEEDGGVDALQEGGESRCFLYFKLNHRP